MSNNASSVSDIFQKPDNPQETLKEENYYYAGFFAAEMSCAVIKATNHNPVGHYYFALDITVSNADTVLLAKVNDVVMGGHGVISPIKGAYNLSARGKVRVRTVLDFLRRYPIIAGECAQARIALMREALAYMELHRGAHAQTAKSEAMDDIRKKLRTIKEIGVTQQSYPRIRASKNAIGHFLAGVLDGDGSFGFKKSGDRLEPYLAVGMKDRKIIELFREFVQHGKVRRRNDGLYHLELNQRSMLQDISSIFLTTYPLQHVRQRARMQNLQRILNDYTRNQVLIHENADDIV